MTPATEPDAGVKADAESRFLGWLERGETADTVPLGTRRSWGQLVITSLGSGYDVRHLDDTGVPFEELERYDVPSEAREIAKFDDGGEYRPMNGETTLRTGWVFPSLDADGLTEVIRRIYPASLENAHLESHGELDVTHWEETAERQTGLYADVDELKGEALRCATEAFCASRCAKRREWQESEDKEIPSETDGDFPCREACSLFVAGAREFVKQERDGVENHEAMPDELTEEAPRRGELSDPANEYRVRYTSSRREEVSDVR